MHDLHTLLKIQHQRNLSSLIIIKNKKKKLHTVMVHGSISKIDNFIPLKIQIFYDSTLKLIISKLDDIKY